MPPLWQLSDASERKVSALRQSVRRPETYLVVVFALVGVACADSFRPPDHQVVGRMYVWAVGAYQAHERLLISGFVECRFEPTCSHYSAEAVRRFGMRKGIILTMQRLWRCRLGVPPHISDPIPNVGGVEQQH